MKRREWMRWCLFLGALTGCAANEAEVAPAPQEERTAVVEQSTRPDNEEKKEDREADEPVVETDGNVTRINGIVLVNKDYGVAADYAPGEDPEALAALMDMIGDMQSAGLDVSGEYSGFRSYQTQADLYAGYVAAYGQQEADTFSARPGFSEHQTGLAFDLKHGSGQLLEGEMEAGWLLDHAGEYGFIVRYQEGKEEVTGYIAEPWHVRYIGEQAPAIQQSGLALEQYLGIK
ncbi:M15 family metallopeptidase [uncultured Dubosiella sp.]|nr:M15 family metallopeptidase [uncultured Dubosiella sp.]